MKTRRTQRVANESLFMILCGCCVLRGREVIHFFALDPARSNIYCSSGTTQHVRSAFRRQAVTLLYTGSFTYLVVYFACALSG